MEPVFTQMRIPKSNGKARIIHAPEQGTKNMGSYAAVLLDMLTCNFTTKKNGFLDSGCFSYIEMPNAMQVMAQKFKDCEEVVHLDIKDYFPSTTKDVIVKTLRDFFALLDKLMDPPFDIPQDKLRYEYFMDMVFRASGVFTYKNMVQGSPVSPILSNLIGSTLIDPEMKKRAQSDVYARFCDDIYLGWNKRQNFNKEDVIDKLCRPISVYNFNVKKVEIMNNQDPSRFIVVLGVHPDKGGGLKIPSRIGKKLKSQAFNVGRLPTTKENRAKILSFRGKYTYIKQICTFNRKTASSVYVRQHPEFKGSIHYMKKLQRDVKAAYYKGMMYRIQNDITKNFEGYHARQ